MAQADIPLYPGAPIRINLPGSFFDGLYATATTELYGTWHFEMQGPIPFGMSRHRHTRQIPLKHLEVLDVPACDRPLNHLAGTLNALLTKNQKTVEELRQDLVTLRCVNSAALAILYQRLVVLEATP